MNHNDRIYGFELVKTAAVKVEAAAHVGVIDQYSEGVMRGVASLLATVGPRKSADEIIEESRERAKKIFREGQDWRRELALFDQLVESAK